MVNILATGSEVVLLYRIKWTGEKCNIGYHRHGITVVKTAAGKLSEQAVLPSQQ